MAQSALNPQGEVTALISATGLSLRELGRRLGYKAPTILRWSRGQGSVPEVVMDNLRALAAESREPPEAVVLKTVGDGGKTVRELLGALPTPRHRRAALGLLDSGGLRICPVPRVDRRGRYYSRDGVFRSTSSTASRGLDRSAPRLDGSSLGAARRARGLSVEKAARLAGVAPSTWRGWEATEVPRARVPAVHMSLGPAPTPDQIRRARQAAEWTLAELAERVGVALGTVGSWESGRKVPSSRIPKLTAALAEADSASRALHVAEAERIAAIVAERPGITTAELRHRLRRTRQGAARFDRLRTKALRFAIRSGLIVEIDVAVPDSQGRLRHRRSCFPPGHQVPFQVTMSGDELWHLRDRRGWTQADVASLIQVSKSLISTWERRHDAPIPGAWAARLRELDAGLGVSLPAELASRRVVEAVRSSPGIPQWRLLGMTDHTAGTRRAIDLLRSEGEVVVATAYDSLGRPYRGLYLPGSEPQPPARFERGELRRLRKARALSASSLGGLVGVRGNTVTRWEQGVRRCPPDRAAELRRVLAS